MEQGDKLISFSQHGVLAWPAVQRMLPPEFLSALPSMPPNYIVDLEQNRPPLPPKTRPFPDGAGENWLNKLPIDMIRGLADTFFATFNGLFPVLDRTYFFSFTLGTVLDREFDYSTEAATVLVVLALGCIAVEGHREGDFPLPRGDHSQPSSENLFDPPDWYGVVQGEDHPGLRFFNEARKRFGFVFGVSDLASCQLFLLCAFYNTQIIRPFNSYVMLQRAALTWLTALKG